MANLISSIPGAVAGLLADLETVAGRHTDIGLEVVDSQEGTNIPPNFVVIGDVKEWVQSSASLGNRRRHEHYVIDCLLNCHDGGEGTYEAPIVRTLAWALFAEIVEAITADWTLGGAVRFAEVTGGPSITQGISNIGGWSVQIEFHVHCQVTLQL